MTTWGGDWTEDKLRILRGYLEAYLKVLSQQRHRYSIGYVDAFAGAGYRRIPRRSDDTLFGLAADEAQLFRDGSARIALSLSPGFDGYLFIEKSRSKCEQLEAMKPAYPSAKLKVHEGDANDVLLKISELDWSRRRAVVFLDPYGMQVDWSTLEALARTKAVDIWLLVPVGIAILRMLARDFDAILPKWKIRLDKMLGTAEWQEVFYADEREVRQTLGLRPLFTEDDIQLEGRRIRRAKVEDIAAFYLERLRMIFPTVAKPRMLHNSRGFPLYMLCFVGANPHPAASKTSLRIASHLLGDNITL